MITITIEEKRRLNVQRAKGVREVWKNEEALVLEGKGTRQWTESEQQELIETHHISGYYGHHKKSVAAFPEMAANPDNIQFLNADEHINGAHQSNTRIPTNGYYNIETRTIEEYNGNELVVNPVYDLENPIVITQSISAQEESYSYDTSQYEQGEEYTYDTSQYESEEVNNDFEQIT